MSEAQNNDAFGDSAKDLLERLNNETRTRALRDRPGAVDRAIWRQIAEAGWFSVLVGEEDDGLGLGLNELVSIAREAGASLLPEPYITASTMMAVALADCPATPLRTRLLDALMAGELLAGLAWQEREGQLACDTIETLATRNGDALELTGSKVFVTPALDCDGWLVLARREDGAPLLVWVAAGLAGVSRQDRPSVDGSVLAELRFDHVVIDQNHLLAEGDAARQATDHALDCARIVVAADLLGAMDRAFAITLDYVKIRKQFGRAIGSFQALKHKIVDCYVQIEIARACLEEGLRQISAGESLALVASRVKARCSGAAMLVTREAIQFHGAIGFTDECNIGLYLKRAMFESAWLGSASRHRARYLALQPAARDTTAADAEVEIPADENWNAMSEQDFRSMLRTFYRRNYPEEMRNIQRRLYWDEVRDWTGVLSRQGWLAPNWPSQFGGMGLVPEKLIAFVEEQEGHGVARTLDMGTIMVGPLLIKHGTPEQQARFLPKILTAEHRWCQGYSEPGAGSDLAAVSTEAILDGDAFVVNGQKIWTTLAQNTTHCFALVRTDKKAKKQAGISFLLIDLAAPGITIRPIRDIGGHVEFCEVFFKDVRVPAENLVGEINKGWTMAKALLGFERIFLGSPKQGRYALSQLNALAESKGLFSNDVFRARYAELLLDVNDQAAGYARFVDMLKRGESLPPSVSLLKIWGTETYQKICLLLYEYAEETAPIMESCDPLRPSLTPAPILFNAIPATIYGGSSQVQREIIARNVLNIPEE